MLKKNNTVIASNVKFCNSVISKAFGLRFRKRPVDKAYIFTFDAPQTVMMDMWFVFYPIDVVFLDDEKRIVEVKENFLPFTVYSPDKKAKYIIELESGAVKKNSLSVGDNLLF